MCLLTIEVPKQGEVTKYYLNRNHSLYQKLWTFLFNDTSTASYLRWTISFFLVGLTSTTFRSVSAVMLLRNPEFSASLPEPEKARFAASSEQEKTRVERLRNEIRDKLPVSSLILKCVFLVQRFCLLAMQHLYVEIS